MGDSIQELINSLNTTTPAKTGKPKSYLGVPDGYQATVRGPAQTFQPLRGGSRENPTDPAPGPWNPVNPSKPTPGPLSQVDPRYSSGAENEILGWSVEKVARLQSQLAAVGLIGASTKFRLGVVTGTSDPTVTAYRKLLSVANTHGTDVAGALDFPASNPAGSVKGGFGGQQQGPQTTTRTDTSTTHFDDLDARAKANDAWAAANGRAARGKEAAGLEAALNAYAQAHPQISTTTQTVQPDGDVTANTTSRGGISAAGVDQIAMDEAQAAPDYAEFQAAGVYFPALQRALGATADVRGR